MCVRSVLRSMTERTGDAFEAIEAARFELVDRDDCTGKVGVIGFCLGGGFALLSASGRGFDAASVNYGPVPRDIEAILEGACPVLGSYGSRDYTARGAAKRLDAALHASGANGAVKEYPGVGHGFLNDHHGAVGWIMARIGMGYNPTAAEDARRRILDFFDQYLG